ncbi:3-ketoacyl-ACP reductase [Membranicola marinus]|uniref:3-ketoacyl-ACP reductase n=1 Tax=Membranihabitans marinus TaxID=1227546 RepID=A0A953HL77_9BACT|nr:3-ketoacyl-ACP reductase [Membranihabitans marinus]MBY5957969.1 3-ketoacyl-ACP reductase [Membranihabitans marinus]
MKKVALITGGSRGIGLGIAAALAEAGYHLVINGRRDKEKVMDVIESLEEKGAEVLYCQADIASQDDRSGIIDDIKSHFGRLDVLVNNAGVAPLERNDLLDATMESYDRVMKINLQGPYFLTQAAAKWMIDQKETNESFNGCIINVGSVSATMVSVNRGEYCLSKAGMAMMTQLFAVRLGSHDIPVYEIRPGVIATDMTSGVKEKYDRLIEEGLMVQRRWGQPEDNGKVVVALAEGYFPYSTGQVIRVDGGMTIPRL